MDGDSCAARHWSCYIVPSIFCMAARPHMSIITHAEFQRACQGACSVAASYKPPMLVTRVRLPACAFSLFNRASRCRQQDTPERFGSGTAAALPSDIQREYYCDATLALLFSIAPAPYPLGITEPCVLQVLVCVSAKSEHPKQAKKKQAQRKKIEAPPSGLRTRNLRTRDSTPCPFSWGDVRFFRLPLDACRPCNANS